MIRRVSGEGFAPQRDLLLAAEDQESPSADQLVPAKPKDIHHVLHGDPVVLSISQDVVGRVGEHELDSLVLDPVNGFLLPVANYDQRKTDRTDC